MPLSCSCYCDWEPGQRVSYGGEDFESLKTKRSRKCSSCGKKIKVGDLSVRFAVFKVPEYEVEINIYGEDGEIPMAPRYMCEKCGEIYHNLEALGFSCIWPDENMPDMLREYIATYQPPALKTK